MRSVCTEEGDVVRDGSVGQWTLWRDPVGQRTQVTAFWGRWDKTVALT
jgi:hypothetical protein